MGVERSRREVLLALALGIRRGRERRILPDRRSGIDRRTQSIGVSVERRSGLDRRDGLRRRSDVGREGGLLQRARRRESAQ
jgi:hypothetical protein